MSWRRDCRHFVGDRPCRPHKLHGVHCDACEHYLPGTTRIAIVKLAAAGDVLRSTSILKSLRAAVGPSMITWITKPASVPLFGANPEVDRVLRFDGSLPVELVAEDFDLVVNLDAAPDSCAIASSIRGKRRIGFGLGDDGKPMPLHPEAERWFGMGLSDATKKVNTETYQALMFEILGVPMGDYELIFELTDAERARAASWATDNGVAGASQIVGLNTGAGGRWPLKKWTLEGYRALIDRLAEHGAKVLLLGGPEEAERNHALRLGREDKVIDVGCDNALRDFAALVDLVDVMVTGDTLAMHIAIARRKQLVVMFGPTSAAEIELYGRGEKIVSNDMDCLCCYLTTCDKDPNCMNTISVDTVFDATVRMLEQAAAGLQA